MTMDPDTQTTDRHTELGEVVEVLEVLEAVDHETQEQSAIDDYDEPAATKVTRRDAARSALESELGIEEDPGPNPS
jgi:hypothetical protein